MHDLVGPAADVAQDGGARRGQALAEPVPVVEQFHALDGTALDSFIVVGALAAITTRILLISTVHVLYGPWHPLHFAKFGATLDHIARGRWGVNVVTGQRAVEHEMFGWPQIEHDQRYERATEFLDVVQRLWRAPDDLTFEDGRWPMRRAFV